MRIAAVGTALPAHRYSQATITSFLRDVWQDRPEVHARLAGLHDKVQVESRHLTLPLDHYPGLDTFGKCNDAWIQGALELGERAIGEALARAGLVPRDVDALFTVSVTGIASPSLDARLMNRMPLRADLKRSPIFGLGCVAGAAGITRAADYVRAYPDQVAVLLAVELCSLTFQPNDLSAANLISAGLFGDGAAAVVVSGAQRALPGPQVLATRSVFYPATEEVMGWDISERGFQIVLSAQVPEVARNYLGRDVDAFLEGQGLTRADIDLWICHPGGPKVLLAVQEALGLTDAQVALAWRVLAEQGNLSSASVLMVLERTLATQPKAGTRAMLTAMGPGFCSELVLLGW
jgi:alkylresorcinol/alkylpyrone synthase